MKHNRSGHSGQNQPLTPKRYQQDKYQSEYMQRNRKEYFFKKIRCVKILRKIRQIKKTF